MIEKERERKRDEMQHTSSISKSSLIVKSTDLNPPTRVAGRGDLISSVIFVSFPCNYT